MSASSLPRPIDIDRILKYAPAELIGREAETALLNDAWAKAQTSDLTRPRILTFVALGGEGKTSLVAKWAVDLAAQDWPGCDAAFAWSFYSQGSRDQAAVSSDLFLAEALAFFGDAAMAGSAQGAFEKGKRLAQLVGERRALLILDGLEPLQYAPTSPTPGELKDQGLAVLLRGLAASNRGLCVVTTRYALPDLRAFLGKTMREERLLRLARSAGVQLLKALGVKGAAKEFEVLVEDVRGHALTLNLLGTYLRDAHAGDIRKRDLVKLEEADAEEQGGHAFHVMDAYVRAFESGGERGQRALAVLRLMGLFDRPASADCLNALWRGEPISGLTEPLIGLSDSQRNLTLQRLEDARLLTVNRATGSGEIISLDAHPLLREYFAERVRVQQPEAWRAAHRRLYEHLCETTKEGDEPTLEDLQPLYQAVAHGCQAGLQKDVLQNVLIRRIFRGTGHSGNFSMYRLGAIGSDLVVLTHFFDTPWRSVSNSIEHDLDIWTLSAVAFRLRAAGRIVEAVEPITRAFELAMARGDNWQASIRAPILSEIRLILGEISIAIEIGETAIKVAALQHVENWRIAGRSVLADALLQSGDLVQSRRCNDDYSDCIVKNDQDKDIEKISYLKFESVRGFRFCESLLANAECVAWTKYIWQSLNSMLRTDQTLYDVSYESISTRQATSIRSISIACLLTTCRTVTEHTRKFLAWDAQYGRLLDSGLHHLAFGRAVLYGTILEQSARSDSPNLFGEGSNLSRLRVGDPVETLTSTWQHLSHRSLLESDLDEAVADLRRAGHRDHLPRGLLTRAWLRALTGSHTGPNSAQEDLDEAWEIAERGPMRLHMADIHLYRARLFFNEKPYPWLSARHDLAEARRLIEKCGYWRRKEELEDAEAAAKSWPDASTRPAQVAESTHPAVGEAPTITKPSTVPQPPTTMRQEILSLFRKLRPHQFDELVFLLEVPVHQRPAAVLDFEHKKNELLNWAEGPPSKMENLLKELCELLGVPPPKLPPPSPRAPESKIVPTTPVEKAPVTAGQGTGGTLPAVGPPIVLITVNENETHAVLDAYLGESKAPAQVTRGGVTYNDLGTHGGYRIIHTICEMGAGGVGAAQQRTRDAVDHWRPVAIIAVGIAFGIDEKKQKIGDVLVSKQLQDYELGRLNANGTLTPRGDKPSGSDILRNRIQQTDVREKRTTSDWPRVQFGLVLCGQKLVDNVDYRESLKALFPEAIGGEMEGVGLYVSATAAKTDWIVVKGICDWGHKKNRADKDAWQKLAARNAARVVKAALDVGGLYPGTPATETSPRPADERANDATPRTAPKAKPSKPKTAPSPALAEWKKKLEAFQVAEARESDAAALYKLQQLIAEAKAKIRELGGSL